jgi:hypothetical protein
VVAAVLGVVVAGVMLWVATVYVSHGNGKGQLAPTGSFTVRTAAIRDEVPFLLPDASPAHRRDLYIQHIGSSDLTGWLAFSAYAPGQTKRECHLRWTGRSFREPCTGEVFPADGRGLTAYRTSVRNGRLTVELNRR